MNLTLNHVIQEGIAKNESGNFRQYSHHHLIPSCQVQVLGEVEGTEATEDVPQKVRPHGEERRQFMIIAAEGQADTQKATG